jgi:hypothetical protein
MHALAECDCYFKPRDFVALVEKERGWFELLQRLSRRRDSYPRGIEAETLTLMLRDRARQLRN